MTNLSTHFRLLIPVHSFLQAWQIRPQTPEMWNSPQPKYVYISLIFFSISCFLHICIVILAPCCSLSGGCKLKCIPHFNPNAIIKNNSWASLNEPTLFVRFMWMTLREMLLPLLHLGRRSHSRRWFQSPHRVSWKTHMFI